MTAGEKLRWVVAGGGTGGHVTPALALAERIAARGDEVLLLGTERGLERRLVPEAGFELLTLPARQLTGQGLAAQLAAGPALLKACASAWRMLGRRRIDLVISVGGYASVPAVVAAATRRLPIAVVEPNAIPGRANRVAARLATRLFVQFEEAAEALAASGGAGRVRTAGIPLRAALVAAFAAAPPRRVPTPPWRLLVFGGSQGARQLNDAMLEAIPSLAGTPLEIFHQTGEADRERVASAYARPVCGPRWRPSSPRCPGATAGPTSPCVVPAPSRSRSCAWRRYPPCWSPTPTPRTITSGRTPGPWPGPAPRACSSPRRSRGRRWPACCASCSPSRGSSRA